MLALTNAAGRAIRQKDVEGETGIANALEDAEVMSAEQMRALSKVFAREQDAAAEYLIVDADLAREFEVGLNVRRERVPASFA